MKIIEVSELGAPELDVYVRLTGAQLRRSEEDKNGIFIAESPNVIEVALSAGCEPISILTDEKLLLSGAVQKLIANHPDIPIYTAKRDTLTALTGFELTRGALAAMGRPAPKMPEEVCRNAHRIAVLENICDSTNIGAIFRSAAALGIDAVLITPTCCDPLCRRAIRVSMGTVFCVPWAKIGDTPADWPRDIEKLHSLGFSTAAMALSCNTLEIDSEILAAQERLAIILGTEGTGLMSETIEKATYTVKIPMSHGVDSLNVAAAGAVAFWELRYKKGLPYLGITE